MKVQLYTLSEITQTLRSMSHREDSITSILKAGDFRTRFEDTVKEIRFSRDQGGLPSLIERITPSVLDNEPVYNLDDIQGALTKQHFSTFIKFLHTHNIFVDADQTTYVPQHIVELFINGEQDIVSLEEMPDSMDDGLQSDNEEDQLQMKFA